MGHTIAGESWNHIKNCNSLFLSSLNPDQTPHASYAPFVVDERKCFYVLLSDLAQHTSNIIGNPAVSILIAEDERDCEEIFARKRVSMNCTAHLLTKNNNIWPSIIGLFKHRFGDTVDLLIQLPDFNLFELLPDSGTYVKGFGQAYKLNPPDFLSATHITSGQLKRDNNS